jgi:hypothetical protein
MGQGPSVGRRPPRCGPGAARREPGTPSPRGRGFTAVVPVFSADSGMTSGVGPHRLATGEKALADRAAPVRRDPGRRPGPRDIWEEMMGQEQSAGRLAPRSGPWAVWRGARPRGRIRSGGTLRPHRGPPLPSMGGRARPCCAGRATLSWPAGGRDAPAVGHSARSGTAAARGPSGQGGGEMCCAGRVRIGGRGQPHGCAPPAGARRPRCGAGVIGARGCQGRLRPRA